MCRRYAVPLIIIDESLFFNSLSAVPARIINISLDVSVNEGGNVNLYCLAEGRPEPTVTWKTSKCE